MIKTVQSRARVSQSKLSLIGQPSTLASTHRVHSSRERDSLNMNSNSRNKQVRSRSKSKESQIRMSKSSSIISPPSRQPKRIVTSNLSRVSQNKPHENKVKRNQKEMNELLQPSISNKVLANERKVSKVNTRALGNHLGMSSQESNRSRLDSRSRARVRTESNKQNIHPNLKQVVIRPESVMKKGRTIKQIKKGAEKQVKEASGGKSSTHLPELSPIESQLQRKTPSFGFQTPGSQDSLMRYIPEMVPQRVHSISITQFLILHHTAVRSSMYAEYLAIHLQSHTVFCIRQYKKETILEENFIQQFCESIKIHMFMSRTNSPYIQKIYTLFSDLNSVYLLLEPLCSKHSLREILKAERASYNESKIAYNIKKVASLIHQMHEQSVLVRSITTKNLIESWGVLKLSDISIATMLKDKRRRSSFFGQIKEAPPELCTKMNYGLAYDMWSLGLVAYQMVTGLMPIQSYSELESVLYRLPWDSSNVTLSFLGSLLCEEQKRMTAQQALNHHFLKEGGLRSEMAMRDITLFWLK